MDPFDALGPEARSVLVTEADPAWRPPMLATLVDAPIDDPGWFVERKLDGVRLLARAGPAGVRLWSRRGRPSEGTYPEVVAALASVERTVLLDGEVVAFDGDRTSFERLQARMGLTDPVAAVRTGVAVTYVVFDLLHLDGWATTGLSLRDRRALLTDASALVGHGAAASPLLEGGGTKAWERACADGWEGTVTKRAASTYQSRRSGDWRKLVCLRAQELVVGGFTPPQGGRTGFGALLLGYHDDDGALHYAGKVGTGLTDEVLRGLRRVLDLLGRDTTPFADVVPERSARWVDPELVAQVAFTDWTHDGRLRHPRFLGLRTDKAAAEVRREAPGSTEDLDA